MSMKLYAFIVLFITAQPIAAGGSNKGMPFRIRMLNNLGGLPSNTAEYRASGFHTSQRAFQTSHQRTKRHPHRPKKGPHRQGK